MMVYEFLIMRYIPNYIYSSVFIWMYIVIGFILHDIFYNWYSDKNVSVKKYQSEFPKHQVLIWSDGVQLQIVRR